MKYKRDNGHMDLTKGTVSGDLIEQTQLRQDIAKYWVGNTDPHVGLSHVDYSAATGGKLVKSQYLMERRDIGILQIRVGDSGANVFVGPDGTWDNVQPWGGDCVYAHQLPPEEKAWVDAQVKKMFDDNAELFARQQRWYAEKPWEQIIGLTPEEAVVKLESMGW
jgi:hypothetical protein